MKQPNDLEKICIYRKMYDTGNSSTFYEYESNKKLVECTKCNGYDTNCEVYVELIKYKVI